MKKVILLSTAAAVCVTTLFAIDLKELAKRSDKGIKKPTMEYKIPDESTIPNNQYGDLVKYGKELTVNTFKYIGPEVEDPKMRFAGNNLSCQSCHLDAGTKAYSAPFVGTAAEFPQYRPREDTIGTLSERVNGCMQRSMNGYPLPPNSKEMKAFEAYIHWLSQGVPVGGAKMEGRGLAKIDRKMVKQRAADPKAGEKVYEVHCVACHGANGEGIKNEGLANGYMYPPLWGEDSYNRGAGMFRLLKAADFIKSNMPLGATNEHPILTDAEAYDVAAFMNLDSHYRPEKINRSSDFSDVRVKAADVPKGPYMDKESETTHKFGPYGNIIKN
ncbi:MAG: c-type cytochrome [Arcobacteraceae bacterium]|nr:c-type cytochrome [Arcobacteraceae bacterium]MDY0326865.1 c-type cytochrome [Arcobacteraceae bacterium]